MDTSFELPYYVFRRKEKFNSIKNYYKFLNWIQGEFDLFFMDDSKDLKVYYPNGWFTIKILEGNTENTYFEICVKCKSKKNGIKIFENIQTVYRNLIKISVDKI
jgi:hypothetical protein